METPSELGSFSRGIGVNGVGGNFRSFPFLLFLLWFFLVFFVFLRLSFVFLPFSFSKGDRTHDCHLPNKWESHLESALKRVFALEAPCEAKARSGLPFPPHPPKTFLKILPRVFLCNSWGRLPQNYAIPKN